MPDFYIPPYIDTLAEQDAWLKRQQRVQNQVSYISKPVAMTMAAAARMYPTTAPGVIRSLAQAGYGADSPIMQYAAYSYLRSQAAQGLPTPSNPLGTASIDRRYTPAQRRLLLDDARNANDDKPPIPLPLLQQAQELGLYNRYTGLWNDPRQVRADRGLGPGNTFSPDDPNYDEAIQLENTWNQVRTAMANAGVRNMVTFNQGHFYNMPTQYTIPIQADHAPESLANIGAHGGSIDRNSPTGVMLRDINRQNMGKPSQLQNPSFLGLGGGPPDVSQLQGNLAKLLATPRNTSPLTNLNSRTDPNAGPAYTAPGSVSQASADPFAAINPAIRGTFIAFNAGYQELQGEFRNIVAAVDQNPATQANFKESQSDLGIIIPQLLRGEEVDTGSGILLSPDSQVNRTRYEREATRGQIGGHNITLGRQFADMVGLEPDTWQFNLVSGLGDATASIVADPTTYALGAAGSAGRASRTFKALNLGAESAEEGADIARLAREAQAALDQETGLIRGLHNTIQPQTSVSFVTNHPDITQTLADLDSPYKIAKFLNFQTDTQVYRDLAPISDVAKVQDYLITQIERGRIRSTEQLTGNVAKRAMTTFYDPTRKRIAAIMPGNSMNIEDPNQFSQQVIRNLVNAKAPEETIESFFNRAVTADYKSDYFKIWEDMLKEESGILDSHGVRDAATRAQLTQGIKQQLMDEAADYWRQIGEDRPTWDYLTDGEDAIKGPSPHLLMEYISNELPLPDTARNIRRLTSTPLGKIIFARGSVNNNVIAKALNGVDEDAPGLAAALKRLSDRATHAEFTKYNGELRLPLAAVDTLAQYIWKPFALLRAAWPIRVLMDLQLRMSASPYSGILNHPIDYLALLPVKKHFGVPFPTSLGEKGLVPFLGQRAIRDPGGEIWREVEQVKEALVAKGRIPGLVDQPAFRPGNYANFTKGIEAEEPDFLRAWADTLAKYSDDGVVQQYFRSNFDDTVDSFFYGDLRTVRKNIQAGNPGKLRTYTDSQNYVRTLQQDMEYLTSNNDELMDVIRTGKFKVPDPANPGQTLEKSIWASTGKPDMNPRFTEWLKTRMEDFAPNKVHGVRAGGRVGDGEPFKRMLNWLFGNVMGRPENYFARSPLLRQAAWRNTIDMLPFVDAKAQEKFLANAAEANLSRSMMKGLRRASARGSGPVPYDEALFMVRAYAVDETKGLLFDMSKRHQLSDMYRGLVPFGEAYNEVITRWAKILTDQGIGAFAGRMPNTAVGNTVGLGLYIGGFLFNKPVRRLQQGLQAAQGQELGQFLGSPMLPNEHGELVQQGFFWTNPQTGDEMFYFPMSAEMMANMPGGPGVPFPLAARVEGLNMFSTFIPSLGPMAQLPVAWLADKNPGLEQQIRDYLLPFGSAADNPSGLFDFLSYAPPWLKSAVTAFSHGSAHDMRLFGSTQQSVAAYLYSTGEYDISTPAGVKKLNDDAAKKAGQLYMVRSFAQFFAPSSPSPQFLIEDPDGKLLSLAVLTEDYYHMKEEDWSTANERFLETYGENALFAMIPKSTSDTYGVVRTREGARWMEQNSWVTTNLPLTANLFAPQTGKFDYATYLQSFLSGERDPIDTKTWIRMGNNVRAEMWYRRAIEERGGDINSMTDDEHQELRDIKEVLRQTFPGFDDGTAGLAEKPGVAAMVSELNAALDTPSIRHRLEDTDAGQGLIDYWEARQAALDIVAEERDQGLTDAVTPFRAKYYRDTREWLRSRAEDIIAEHPDFAGLWDIVFKREMIPEDQER